MSVHFDPSETGSVAIAPATHLDTLVGALAVIQSVAGDPRGSEVRLPDDLDRRYQHASSIARRRFDAVALESARTAASGIQAMLGGCNPAAVALLAEELRGSLRRLAEILPPVG